MSELGASYTSKIWSWESYTNPVSGGEQNGSPQKGYGRVKQRVLLLGKATECCVLYTMRAQCSRKYHQFML